MDKVLYCKSSNERDRRFSLHTIMAEDESGKRFFYKMPDTSEAGPHVRRIALCGQKLEEFYGRDGIHINRCRLTDRGAELEYLEGTTVEDEIDAAYSEKGQEAACALIGLFFDRMLPQQKLRPFEGTEEFRSVFGTHPELDGLPAVSPADIDMTFSNVICNADGWHLIDYEWTFFFPVPAEFLRFRALHYYLETSSRRGWLTKSGWSRWDIDPARTALWEEMEESFQRYIFGSCTPLQELYVQMSPGMIDLRSFDDPERFFKKDAVRIYWSRDEELSEEQTLLFPISEGWNRIHVRLPEGTKKIRLDPGEHSAVCSLRKWQIDGKDVRIAAHNGVQITDQVWVFPGEDPQWTAVSERDPVSVLEAEIKIQQMDPDLLEGFAADAGRNKKKRLFFK